MKPPRHEDLEVVGTYALPHEALVAKSAVEAFGVPAWILDEKRIRFKAYMGEPVGAVKLVVRAQDAETAREILTGDHSADLAAVPESHLPPSADELCPRCGTELVDLRRRKFGRLPEWLRALASALRGGGSAPDDRPAGRCPACGHVER